MNSPITPTGKHAVVRITKDADTAGGIIIPESNKERRYVRAELLALGPRCDLNGLAVGGVLWVHRWGGEVVKVDGAEYMVITDRDVAGVVA